MVRVCRAGREVETLGGKDDALMPEVLADSGM